MSDDARVRKVKGRKSRTRRLSKIEIADRHLSSFEILYRKGEIRQSFYNLSIALEILPSLKDAYYSSFLEVFESWSTTVEENHGFQEAVKLFEVALKHYPESADVKYLLAKILYRHGSTYEAWSYACLAHSECTQDPNAQETRGRLANALIDRWHMPMLNDIQRNKSFKGAIEEAVKGGHDEVLDIGSGTGLLSVFAKWAGAKKVYGCEVDKFMCEIANNILKSNGRTTAGINIFNLHSRHLTIPLHIPERVSLVVSETVDAGLLGEHILSTLQHAWAHFLLPPPPTGQMPCSVGKTAMDVENQAMEWKVTAEGKQDLNIENPYQDTFNEVSVKYGKVIPSNAEVFVALINCQYIANCTKLDDPDLLTYFQNRKVLLKLDEPYMSEKLNQIPGGFKLLSEWTPVTKIDFNSPYDIDCHLKGLVNKTLELVCTSEGTADALALAFNLQLDDTHCISTFPKICSTAWENALYPVSIKETLSINDVMKVDFDCCGGVINLSVQPEVPVEPRVVNESLLLSANALTFLTRKNFVNTFLAAAKETALKLKNGSRKSPSYTFIICDITPFPIAGLAVLSMFSNAQLYVEEESILKTLEEMGIHAKLTEDLEEEVDLLFMWPVTKEGTLQDGIIKRILMYRLMMAEGGVVFPQKLDLVVDAVNSPAVTVMTQVDDSNTCGVRVADVFNIAKTNHHVDVHLDKLPHTSVLSRPIPVLQLSLSSGNVEALGKLCEHSEDNDLLVLGGDVVPVIAEATAIQSNVINALPYWFIMRAESNSQMVSFCTRESDSPCKQSLLVLDHSSVVGGKPFDIKVIWRDGIFSASISDPTHYLPVQ